MKGFIKPAKIKKNSYIAVVTYRINKNIITSTDNVLNTSTEHGASEHSQIYKRKIK